jgi:flagellar biosynthetic protein FliR
MPLELARLYTFLPAAMLVVFRMAGLMITAPLFSSTAIPVRLRVWVAVGLAAVVMPVVWPTVPSHLTLLEATVGLAGELMLGMLLGLGVSLVFVGIQMGGLMIGQQAGIALAEVFNPAMESESTVLGEMYFFIALVVFLLLNGHHALIRALVESFRTVPVLSFAAGPEAADVLVEALWAALVIAIRLAAPAVIALFLASVALNCVARTVPQLNILVVGFPIRVLLAVFISAVAMSGTQDLLCTPLNEVLRGFEGLLRSG